MNDNENMAGSSSSPISSVAPQSPDIGDSINGINFTNTAVSPSLISQSAKKGRGHPREYHTDTARNQLLVRRRGRPPKYQTDAEREEAKRRYRENHKTKAAGGGVSNFGNASATANFAVASQPKQQDIDDSGLQEQVAGSIQLAQRDVAALPGQKRRKV
ncbi:hypothetical protein D6D23_08828 [Aureobasidium pullulans]|nr:hypothetical protein D6D23_08828 [Aureobasidium pullulans]